MTVLRPPLSLLICVAASASGRADTITYTGSGTGLGGQTISASAKFDIVGYNFTTRTENPNGTGVLKVTLTNTATTTTDPANLLTGLFLTVNPDLIWGTTAANFDGTAPVVTTGTGTSTNVDIAPAIDGTATDGGWALTNGGAYGANGTFTTYNGYNMSDYNMAISTIGGGYPGIKGKNVGPPADNYAIYSATTPSLSNSLNQQLPLIKGYAVFYILPTGGGSLTSVSNQITGVAFMYGSGPDYRVVGNQVPLPSGLVLFLTGMAPLSLVFRRWSRTTTA